MTAVIHILNNDNLLDDNENLVHNKSLFQINYNHFLITNLKNPRKILYNEFEQIFYTQTINTVFFKNILNLLQNINYKNFIISNSKFKTDKNIKLNDLDEFVKLLDKFSVIDYFVQF